MDILPSGGIFRELQVVHDTGYFSGQASLEEDWHQVYKIPIPEYVPNTVPKISWISAMNTEPVAVLELMQRHMSG